MSHMRLPCSCLKTLLMASSLQLLLSDFVFRRSACGRGASPETLPAGLNRPRVSHEKGLKPCLKPFAAGAEAPGALQLLLRGLTALRPGRRLFRPTAIAQRRSPGGGAAEGPPGAVHGGGA